MADQARQMQAATEGVSDSDTLEFQGKSFRLADSIGLMPLMRFAHVAQQGTDSDDMAGLAAMYDLIRGTIHAEDWDAFEAWVTECRAGSEELMGFVTKAIEAISARPTRRPSDSLHGPSATTPNLTESSPSPAVRTGTGSVLDRTNLVSIDQLLSGA